VARTRSGDAAQTPDDRVCRPIAVDLFAGAGGFALGLEQAGFDVVAAIEYDPVHAAAHAYNFPRTAVRCSDAARLTKDELYDAVKSGAQAHRHGRVDVDVVFGGPPCQGFSSGGRRLPTDERNLLVFDFLRLTLDLAPRFFVLENVPPLKNFPDPDYPGEKLLDRLLEDFESGGYKILERKVLNASRYGVPQDRRRLIVIGARDGEREPMFPEPTVRPVPKRPEDKPRAWEHGGEEDDAMLTKGPTVWDAIGDLPDLDEFDELLKRDDVELADDVLAAAEDTVSCYARRLRELDQDPDDLAYPREWTRSRLTSSRRTLHAQTTVERFAQTQPGCTEEKSRFYRLHRDGLCSTIRAGTGYERGSFMAPRPIHPVLDRVISVREAARLHSFPDWFRFHYSKWHGFRQIGNSLPPLLGRAIGAELVAAMGLQLTKPAEELELGDDKLLTMATYEAAAHFGANLDVVPTHKLRHRKPRTGRAGQPALAA
jgi:DNA (cytosine-5)-methyltransferase 1